MRARADLSWLDQDAVLEPQPAPLGCFATSLRGPVARLRASRAIVKRHSPRVRADGRLRRCGRSSSTTTRSNAMCVGDVVRDRKQRRVAPQLARAFEQACAADSRSSPRNGSSRITSRTPGRSSARPNRTRWPSPPETKPPPSPSGVAGPSGKRSSTRCNSAASMACSSGILGSAGRPYSRFSFSERFQTCTAGSTQAMCGRRRVYRFCLVLHRPPGRVRSPADAIPSSNPTKLDFPAPDGPTIATCSPAPIDSVMSSSTV